MASGRCGLVANSAWYSVLSLLPTARYASNEHSALSDFRFMAVQRSSFKLWLHSRGESTAITRTITDCADFLNLGRLERHRRTYKDNLIQFDLAHFSVSLRLKGQVASAFLLEWWLTEHERFPPSWVCS